LLGGTRTVLAFTDMLHFFANELSGLRGGSFAFPRISPSPL
jgi:hypothetical protein